MRRILSVPATAFRNLTVGRKLAAGSGVALLLLGALVVVVTDRNARAIAEQAAERDALTARRLSILAASDTYRATMAQRGALASNTPEAVRAESQRMTAALAEAGARLDHALASARAPEARAALSSARETLAALSAGNEELVAARLELISRRDEGLYPRSAEFDQAVEAAQSALQFALSNAARDEARDTLATYLAAINDLRVGAQRFLATEDPAAASRVRRSAAQARVHARRLLAAAGAEARSDTERLIASGDRLAAEAEAVLALSQRVKEVRSQRTAPSREQLLERLDAATAVMDREVRERGAAAEQAVSEVTRTVWAVGALVAVMLLLSSWLTARAVGAPLRRLASLVRAMAGGDTATTVAADGRRDEIGQIASALETLRGEVRAAFQGRQMMEQLTVGIMVADPKQDFRITYMNAESARLLRRIEHVLPVPAEKLLGESIDVFHRNPAHQRAMLSDPSRLPHRARISTGGEVLDLEVSPIRDPEGNYVAPMLMWQVATQQATLADRFEVEVGGVSEALAAAAAQMQHAAATLTETARTSGQEAEAVADASGRAGAEVQAVAASAEELAASVAEITRQVAEGARVARAAAEEARATDGTVQGLAEAAARIGDVVRLISDIAGQTNLLALNATIEAARAGEAGKGFAVVASEVKSLASQTARATEDIAAQIGSIQAATQEAVKALRSIGGTVERVNEITTTIAAAVDEQGAATREIARSASLVADGTSNVARRIEDVRAAAGETGRSAAEVLGAAGNLATQASALREKSTDFLREIRAR